MARKMISGIYRKTNSTPYVWEAHKFNAKAASKANKKFKPVGKRRGKKSAMGWMGA